MILQANGQGVAPERIIIDPNSAKMFDAARRVVAALEFDENPAPEEFQTASGRYRSAQEVLAEPPTFGFAWPSKVTDVRKAIIAEAQARAGDRETKIVAAEAAEQAAASSVASIGQYVIDSMSKLDAAMRDAADQFIRASASAPQRLTGRNDKAEVDAYVQRVDAANSVDANAARRLAVASALEEVGAHRTLPWHWAAVPPKMTSADDLALTVGVLRSMAAEREWLQREPTDRWAALLSVLDVDVAPFGGVVADRRDGWGIVAQNATTSVWMTQLGQRDRDSQLPGRLAAKLNQKIQATLATAS